ncbi:DUF2334 domain-containing protein [Solirubrobacter sp. CPCC 204708]|uniref:DUF2334 domain-containing protein n=1 Tax=Solirubrobacter deserti TaxID=2282478 RepID=A0ABT4RQV6_9ACTN|nr:DUF2334 domain-containing protein [Solirubrobacter deserti]MBE2320094.1 DUF2334 domain-containing protein [Solirubrobacter deserti]MDA0140967.1 DUF2334 domain-containing protein [Solirubrobacter deserti]
MVGPNSSQLADVDEIAKLMLAAVSERELTPPRPAHHIGTPVRPAPVDGAKLAVAIHDVEPTSFRRCVEIRDWLRDHGVDRVTLLVIPAPQLHPFPSRSPELKYWLLDCQDAGDAIAQHGLQHRQTRPGPLLARPIRHWQGGRAAEYAGMSATAAAESVEAGRRVLADAGLQPRGFVAPAYAYTGALRRALSARFDWWATLLRVHGRADVRSPALCLGTSGALKRATSPAFVRAGAALSPRVMRLDLHPADFDHPRHLAALERVLGRTRARTAVTYDDLC